MLCCQESCILTGATSKLSCSSMQLAEEMQKAVERHLQGLSNLDILQGMVDHIQKGAPLPSEVHDTSLYVVELLDLSIQQ